MKIITASIDVTLLQKARFKTLTRKSGKTATFVDLVLIETPNGNYGDWMIKQGVTKEEREARVETPIIGNGKNVGGSAPPAPRSNRPAPKVSPVAGGGQPESDYVPF